MSLFNKYQPTNVNDLVLEEEENRYFFRDLVEGIASNMLLLVGTQGVAKTTIAELLPKIIEGKDPYILRFDGEEKFDAKSASDKLKGQLQFAGVDDQKYQYVIFDELDKVKSNLSTFWQVMDNWNDRTIFIATANEMANIHKSMKSRLRTIELKKISAQTFLSRAMFIFKSEGENISEEFVLASLSKVEMFGDIRKYMYVVEEILRNSKKGRLHPKCYYGGREESNIPKLRVLHPSIS
jgi:replication-associated recombination protein RarA